MTADRLYLLNFGIAEVVSVLVRKRNANQISSALFSQAMLSLAAEVIHSPAIHTLSADNALVIAAVPLIELHSVNATDAILLRSALDVASALRTSGSDLVVMATDQRLVRAAHAEGLETFDPETQGQAALDFLLLP